ncbi:hypothetical protein J2S74_001432 [Evansella vedderi]|uniref:DUF3048 domain-containing protein n=1 Tax=Evansella vedderi TaxID=38282 RepID=A0ABT9ZS89_9BACI|nr:DUF3048 domain-containing protein [Evansella vedderi]MDQ0254059.1 hypothetical protein [Evansella vedderi]
MKPARSKFILLLSSFLLLFFILAACKSDEEVSSDEEPADDPIEVEKDSEEEEEEEEVELFTYPLTGIETEEVLEDKRVFGVMIENSIDARPQSGLYQADIVYEILSEGTITRLLALYHSQQPDRIGPVRSARAYYVHLNKGFDAIYVSAGGSPGGRQLAESDYVDDISGLAYDGRYFSRSSDRSAPHNMYTTYDDLVAAAEHRGYDLNRKPPELYFVNELSFAAGDTATSFEVKYGSMINNVRFEYDDASKKYLRYNGGQPTEDQETRKPVAPRNVFIIEASHRVIPKGEDHIDAGSNRREIDIESGGRAYLIQEGIVQEVEWKNDSGIILPYKDGELLPFLPGQTWINIVPSGNGGLESYVEFF